MLKLTFICFCLLVGSAVSVPEPFNCIHSHDYALDSSGFEPVALSEQECAERCMDSESGCTGYHYSNGQCYPLVAGNNWHEERLHRPLRICILRDNPACSPHRFPLAFERSRYVYIKRKAYWRTAAARCERMGAKLLQLGSPHEQAFFIRTLRHQRRSSRFTIIGMTKLPKMLSKRREGWFWHRSGDALDPSIAWHVGEPNNAGGHQITGALFPNGQLDDNNHSASNGYICECLVI